MIKVAVPSRDDMVDPHFGHCESFSIFTIGQGREILEIERLTPPADCGCRSGLIPVLLAKGVSVLLAGGMGQGAASQLTENGIKVVRGVSGPAEAAVLSWAAGGLVDSEDVCHAHGEGACPGH